MRKKKCLYLFTWIACLGKPLNEKWIFLDWYLNFLISLHTVPWNKHTFGSEVTKKNLAITPKQKSANLL